MTANPQIPSSDKVPGNQRQLGYLSAAPRVSTRADAETVGPRSHILGVINAFEHLGWKVSRFIVGDDIPRSISSRSTEKRLMANPLQTLMADIVRIIMGYINARRAWKKLGPHVSLVYERFSTLQSFGWLFKRHGIPWVLETNGLFFKEAKVDRKSLVLSGIARRIELRAYRECDLLVCVSEPLRASALAETRMPPEKVMVIPNGVDTDLFNPQKYTPTRVFPGFTLVFVGTMLYWQGLDLLLGAVAELRSEGCDIAIVAIGDGPMRSSWEELAAKLGLAERVRFMGRMTQVELLPLVAGSDFGYSGHIKQHGDVYHSPLKLYEYMAMGKPIVASAVKDSCELIRDGENGFLYPSGSKEELKAALLRAYQARDRLAQQQASIRQEIIDKHSWASRVEDLLQRAKELSLL